MNKIVRIPLLRDHHSHPLFYGAFSSAVQLHDVSSKNEAQRLLHEYTDNGDNNSGIAIAYGWNNSLFDWPQTEFEKLPPAAVFNVSLHALLLNQAGAEILARRFGDAVFQIKDQDWYERNFRSVLNWFANLNATSDAIRCFYRQLLNVGVWSAEELLLVDENEITLFEEAGLLDRTRFWAAPETFSKLSPAAKKRVAGLKLFTDGALGSRTAALRGSYKDDAQNQGMLLYRDDQLLERVNLCLETGKALAIHAIGDRAIEQCLSILERTGPRTDKTREIRIEHAQMIDLPMARRAKKMGITLSMQPNFSRDSVDYDDRLSLDYCHANNPFRMLINQAGFKCGDDLIFGSDGMPHGVQYAVEQAFFPELQAQTLTLEEFRAGYCHSDLSPGYIELKFGLQGIESNVHTGRN